MSNVWKKSSIIPVPKKQSILSMNGIRPIALTLCTMKVSKKCLLVHLNEIVSDFVDLYQFAYKSNRFTDDAIAHVLNNIYTHLDLLGAIIRLMLFDFSSTFNTIYMNIGPSLITWIIDYLTLRPQFARLNPSL